MADDLLERIRSFEQWHYAVSIGPHLTPIFDPAHAIRHQQRRAHFFDPLVEWLGGLDGRRVLDLGCNAGYWSLLAHRAGASFVRGIDGRQEHVDQCHLVFEGNRVPAEAWRFERADVTTTDLAEGGPWDVVLCLGLLYHLQQPLDLLRRVAELDAEVVVVDTEVVPAPGVWLLAGRDTPADPRSAVGTSRVAVPTPAAIRWALRGAGYQVAVLRPEFSDWTGSADYRHGWRRCLVGAQGRNPASFPSPTERAWALPRDLARLVRRALRR